MRKEKLVGTKRGLEIILLGISLVIGISGYIIVTINRGEKLPSNLFLHIGFLIFISLILHLFIRKFTPYADPIILPIAVAINGVGLAMIYRLNLSYQKLGQTGFDVGNKQLMWTFVGVVCCVLVCVVLPDHKVLKNYTYIAGLSAIILLLLPMVPGLGRDIYGAKIWIGIGPLSFQPSEIAKLCLVIFFAGYFVDTGDKLALAGKKILGLKLPRIRDCGPLIIAWLASIAVLVLQRDLGSSLLIFGLFVAMLYVATDKISWIIAGGVLFVPAAFLVAHIFPHVGARFNIWWNAFDNTVYHQDPGGSGQLVSGLFGMANGGLTGTGWGKGFPQLVPFANSDFIIASIGEELGLTGFMAIITLYIILVQRGFKAAETIRDNFGKMFATGLVFIIALQVFVIVGGVTRLIPLTGLATPFLAYGGSSLVSNWIILGLLLRLTNNARVNSLFEKEVVLMEYEPVKEVVTVSGSSSSFDNQNKVNVVHKDSLNAKNLSNINKITENNRVHTDNSADYINRSDSEVKE